MGFYGITILFFIFLVFLIVFLDPELCFNTAYADSDEDSDNADKAKIDKGKEKATDTNVDLGETKPRSESEERRIYVKKEMELLDREYAEWLWKQEVENFNKDDDSNGSSYSVISSEIHTDDSDETKKKKIRS